MFHFSLSLIFHTLTDNIPLGGTPLYVGWCLEVSSSEGVCQHWGKFYYGISTYSSGLSFCHVCLFLGIVLFIVYIPLTASDQMVVLGVSISLMASRCQLSTLTMVSKALTTHHHLFCKHATRSYWSGILIEHAIVTSIIQFTWLVPANISNSSINAPRWWPRTNLAMDNKQFRCVGHNKAAVVC
jgi:hypothetical protein